MEDYIIVDWPEIQDIMDEPTFEENTTLVNLNDYLGIDYIIDCLSKDDLVPNFKLYIV